MSDPLPIEEVLPDVAWALEAKGCAVLQAPPGAGKTTRVPLYLLANGTAGAGRIIMLEPRRLAARAAARRMASTLGEDVGETVGYRVRFDTKVGRNTRIEVVTEGIFTRMLQSDPSLDGVSVLVFDEFHERSLDADLGLVLAMEARTVFRPDLRLLVMSATMDGEAVAAHLGNAPVVSSSGRLFPVKTQFLESRATDTSDRIVDRALRALWQESEGDVLVFVPGMADIRRIADRLQAPPIDDTALVCPLHGDLPFADQDRALSPAPDGYRKIVIATAIAETSLTIEGVRTVVDAGLSRRAVFDPGTGMTRLETRQVSRAGADQRRGRAGRIGPGFNLRLWTREEDRALVPFDPPEITEADLSPMVLELAAWGETDPTRLPWLDPPPSAAVARARDLLDMLGAIDEEGGITAMGRAMVAMPIHPRLAHMIVRGRDLGFGDLAIELATILSERDPLRGAGRVDIDLEPRVRWLRTGAGGGQRRFRQIAGQLRRIVRMKAGKTPIDHAGLLIALAYPDRIAKNRNDGSGRFLLANGSGVVVAKDQPLAAERWLAVAELDGARRDARVFLAARLSQDDAELAWGREEPARDVISWDDREKIVIARRQRTLGAIVIEDRPLASPPADAVRSAFLSGIERQGLMCLPWTPEAERFRQRAEFARETDPDAGFPDLSTQALMRSLAEWLGAYVDGMQKLQDLSRLDILAILQGLFDWPLRQRLDEMAPARFTVPSGSSVAIDYGSSPPILAVKLQEMFGQAETPRLGKGRVPVMIHLLSPAGRPLQVTQDLEGFWRSGYRSVRSEMRGRYPKHPWPEDPLTAIPTRFVRRKS